VFVAEWHGADDDSFGGSVANAGDVDGDGVDDLLVGETRYSASATRCGRVCVYSGKSHALIRSHSGTQADERLGTAVAGVGDLDGDGYGDYAGASYDFDTTTAADAGRILVWSGSTGSVLWTAEGSSAHEHLGAQLTTIADMDDDGIPELLAGAQTADEARLFDESGQVFLTLHGTAGSGFGGGAARTGDVDGDGHDDFLVSAELYSSATHPYVGEVNVFSGKSATWLFRFEGDEDHDELGSSLAGIDDVDGDGVPDFLVGASLGSNSTYGDWAGYARVVSGSSGATLRTEYGSWGDHMGRALARTADLDRDGIDDYAVTDFSNVYGRVRVLSGRDGSLVWEFDGAWTGSGTNWAFGTALAAGDWNGDGLADLAIGDPSFEDFHANTEPGGVWLHLACPASWESYGAGWPGKNGVPGLVALDDPGVGESIDVQLDNSLGAATIALLFVGFTQTSVPTSAGGTLLVIPTWTVPLSLPASGLVLSDVLPDDPTLYFLDVDLQALEADAFASKKLSFTPGLVLHCGFDL
jgi:hypothetical protein